MTTASVPQANPPAGLPDRRFVVVALMAVMVMASLEMTVTSTAMPTIIGDLHGLAHYSWVASVYMLACTVSMPLYGRLADVWGRKPVVLTAIGLFAGASLLASTSTTMLQLIVCRGMQGLGAGGIMPVVLTILGDLFTLEERAKIQGLFSAVWGTSALAGPALGAILVATLGWRSIFYLMAPLSLAGFGLLVWKYHDHDRPHTTDLNLPGLALLAATCTTLLLWVSWAGGEQGWLGSVVLLVLAAGLGVWLIRHELKAANPVMSPRMIRQAHLGPFLMGSFLMGAGHLCLDTYVPLYVQGGRGGGAAAAAGVVTPVMLTWATTNVFCARLLVRWGFRRLATLGAVLVIAGFAGLLVCVYWELPQSVMTAVLALTGMGFGGSSMSYILGAQQQVGWQQRGLVTSSVTFFRTMGGALGVGILGSLFNLLTAGQMAHLQGEGVKPAQILDPHGHVGLPVEIVTELRAMFGHGLFWVFVGMLTCAVLQWLVSRRIRCHTKPAHVSTAQAMESVGA